MAPAPSINKHRDPDVETPVLFPRRFLKTIIVILSIVMAAGLLIGGLFAASKQIQEPREDEVLSLIVPNVKNSSAQDVVQSLRRAGYEDVRVVDGRRRTVSVLNGWRACFTNPRAGVALPVNERLTLIVRTDLLDCRGKRVG